MLLYDLWFMPSSDLLQAGSAVTEWSTRSGTSLLWYDSRNNMYVIGQLEIDGKEKMYNIIQRFRELYKFIYLFIIVSYWLKTSKFDWQQAKQMEKDSCIWQNQSGIIWREKRQKSEKNFARLTCEHSANPWKWLFACRWIGLYGRRCMYTQICMYAVASSVLFYSYLSDCN